MPNIAIGSYTIRAEAFLTHWRDVDATLTARPNGRPLTIRGGYTRADFAADRVAMDDAIGTAREWNQTHQVAIQRREQCKRRLFPRFIQFRAAVRAELPASTYAALTPNTPPVAARESRILTALDDLARLWEQVDAETGIDGWAGPLVLADDYERADLIAEIAELSGVYKSITEATTDGRTARKHRTRRSDAFYERMVQYRAAVSGRFPADHPLITALPGLIPPKRGGRRRSASAQNATAPPLALVTSTATEPIAEAA